MINSGKLVLGQVYGYLRWQDEDGGGNWTGLVGVSGVYVAYVINRGQM
jgi:hypothetical protein